MSEEAKHTSTPWNVKNDQYGGFGIGRDSKTIFYQEASGEIRMEDRENASFICRAVNKFDAMLEMLLQCRAAMPIVQRPKGLDEVIVKAQAEGPRDENRKNLGDAKSIHLFNYSY